MTDELDRFFGKESELSFKQYQILSRKTAVYPKRGRNINYPILGIIEEVSETNAKLLEYVIGLYGASGNVSGHGKRIDRDDGGFLLPERIELVEKELGDILWYVSAICSEMGIKLSNVAQGNLEKLSNRKEEGTLHGQGDNR
jgi:NTP pyrophosphatase (non-canonical NTP hydrolase)